MFQGTGWASTSREELVDSEKALLQGCPDVATRDVVIEESEDGRVHIHTIDVSPGPKEGAEAPLVIWPGFGMGAASFGLTFRGLAAKITDRAIYAVDWLGYGLSSRPPWTPESIADAEEWFCGALDKWRHQHGFAKIVLAGHSMGGYLAVAYAERYAERVAHVILVSPCGVPQKPSTEDEEAGVAKYPLWLRMLRGVAYGMWERGWSPQMVARTLGPWGRAQVLWYPHRRFADHDQWNEHFTKDTFGPYLWHMAAQDASGEHMLTTLLHPGAWAKHPLVHRIPQLRVGAVSFVYGGDNDWMDWEAARDTLEVIKQRSEGGIADAMSGAPGKSLRVVDEKVVRVPQSGHQLYIDNPQGFVYALFKCLRQPNVVLSDAVL